MFLIDTNVVSALRWPERHFAPTLWLQQQRPSDIFLSVVTIREIERGCKLLPVWCVLVVSG